MPIVGNAAVAGQVAEGSMVPLLIFDATARPDVAEAVRVHEHLGAGDVVVSWGVRSGRGKSTVLLVLRFTRPLEVRAAFEFDVADEGLLVDAALSSSLLYLQPGKPGDRLIHDPDRPKLLVQIPDTDFRDAWEGIFHSGIARSLRRRGLRRRQARRAADEVISSLRSMTTFRMPQR